MPLPNNKKEMQSYLGIKTTWENAYYWLLNYWKTDTIEIWVDIEQHLLKLYESAETVIEKNATMAFYNKKDQLYLERDVLGVSLRSSLL